MGEPRLPTPAGPTPAGSTIEQAGAVRSATLESLRALAALGVLIGHVSYAWPASAPGFVERGLRGGLLGVDLFFVLTGYLLFWPFARAMLGAGERIDLRRYALNRVVRIVPLYLVVLSLLLVVQHGGGSLDQWWRFGLFAQNFSESTLQTVDSPMWSLAVEVHFYVLLPLFAAVVGGAARGRLRVVAGVVAGLGIASLVLWQVLVAGEPSPPRLWEFSLPGRFWLFASGMLISLARIAWAERRPAWLRGRRAAPAAWWVVSLPLWALATWRAQYEVLVAAAAFLTVGSCVLLGARSDLVSRALAFRPLARLGVASYSLYLWHIPVVLALLNSSLTDAHLPPPGHRFLLLATVGVAASCAIALGSYAVIEAPFLLLRRRWAAATPPRAGGYQSDCTSGEEAASTPSTVPTTRAGAPTAIEYGGM